MPDAGMRWGVGRMSSTLWPYVWEEEEIINGSQKGPLKRGRISQEDTLNGLCRKLIKTWRDIMNKNKYTQTYGERHHIAVHLEKL